MNKELLTDRFHYSRDTGTLRWKNPPKGKSYLIGREAGTLEKNGYIYIGINGKQYYAHRIIYFLETGELPKFIDHINGNPDDNRIVNLRAATHRQNMQNRISHRAGQLQGTSFHKKQQLWFSRITINKKMKYLGRFATEQEAHDRYLEALKLASV